MTKVKSSRLSEKRLSELKGDGLTTQTTATKRGSSLSSFASFRMSQKKTEEQAPRPELIFSEDSHICSLCLDDLPENYSLLSQASDPVKKLPCCNQLIHSECYNEYRAHGFSVCHLCRQPLILSSRFDNEEPTDTRDAISVTIEDPMAVSLVAEKNKVGDYNVVTTVKAPSFAEGNDLNDRYGIDLVLVVDVSGSMAGTKINMVVQSIKYLIQEELLSQDRIALVIFNGSAQTIVNFTRISNENKVELVDAVSKALVASGGTNIMDGVKSAINLLKARSHKNQLASILLLSDGCDNYNTPPNDIVREAADMGIAIQSFGYGTDHDSKYMERISKLSCNGGFQYVEKPSQIVPIFAGAISGLASLIAENVQVEISVPRDSSFILDSAYCGSYKVEKKSSCLLTINLLSLLEAETRLITFKVENRNNDDLTGKLLVKVTYTIPGTVRTETVQDYLETVVAFNLQYHEIRCESIMTKAVEKALNFGDLSNFEDARKTLEEAKMEIEKVKTSLVEKQLTVNLSALDDYIVEIGKLMPRFKDQHQYSVGGRSATTEVVGNYQQQRMLNTAGAFEGSNMARYTNVASKKSSTRYKLFSK
ncbi:hypothetical protein HK103_002995 [Boothiomyces macroporosus]|uniref:VWFA domain-containing protein n=1 Tax=Boothiomyces macroporosus TaxID=261099 RepID=A0AAD5Y4W6_9FUNG|nr:hypothetical protein HK103_002995 [Boothiomyces macroporosus]